MLKWLPCHFFDSQTPHKVINEEHCPEGNYVILACVIFQNTYTKVNRYGPNEDRPAFFFFTESIRNLMNSPQITSLLEGLQLRL